MDHLLIIVAAVAALAFSSKVHAITPQDLMTKAMRDGKAQGELTGSMADQLGPSSFRVETNGDNRWWS